MPQIGPAEIVVVLLIALLVFGPHKLPEVGRQVGRGLCELRKLQDAVKGEIDQVMTGITDEDTPSSPEPAAPIPAPAPVPALGARAPSPSSPPPAGGAHAPSRFRPAPGSAPAAPTSARTSAPEPARSHDPDPRVTPARAPSRFRAPRRPI